MKLTASTSLFTPFTIMSEIDVAQFLGCSPTLNTAVGSTGKAGQNYKYDLIPGGSNGGVYVDQ